MKTALDILHDEQSLYDEGGEAWKVLQDAILRVQREADEVATLRGLLAWHTDDDDCSFDHHGGCQTHGHLEPAPGEVCPNYLSRQVLAGVPMGPPDATD